MKVNFTKKIFLTLWKGDHEWSDWLNSDVNLWYNGTLQNETEAVRQWRVRVPLAKDYFKNVVLTRSTADGKMTKQLGVSRSSRSFEELNNIIPGTGDLGECICPCGFEPIVLIFGCNCAFVYECDYKPGIKNIENNIFSKCEINKSELENW